MSDKDTGTETPNPMTDEQYQRIVELYARIKMEMSLAPTDELTKAWGFRRAGVLYCLAAMRGIDYMENQKVLELDDKLMTDVKTWAAREVIKIVQSIGSTEPQS